MWGRPSTFQHLRFWSNVTCDTDISDAPTRCLPMFTVRVSLLLVSKFMGRQQTLGPWIPTKSHSHFIDTFSTRKILWNAQVHESGTPTTSKPSGDVGKEERAKNQGGTENWAQDRIECDGCGLRWGTERCVLNSSGIYAFPHVAFLAESSKRKERATPATCMFLRTSLRTRSEPAVRSISQG